MLECEAREWIKRYKTKQREIGVLATKAWWSNHVVALEKIRGKDEADKLRKLMREIQNGKA